MQLDPCIEAALKYLPPMPAVRSMPVAALRESINKSTAAVPKLDVPLESVTDRTIPGPGGALPIRIYTPRGTVSFPLLIYFHGGGYVIGDLNISDSICRSLCYRGECIVMSVDYRLAPEYPFPHPNEDAYAATLWASRNAAEIGADPGRLALGGDSAGANLAAATTLRARDEGGPKLRAQVLMYPSTGYPDPPSPSFSECAAGPLLTADDSLFYWSQYLGDIETHRKNPAACPIVAPSHRDLPPAFVATGECDPLRDSGEAYAAKLQAAGVATIRRRYAGMPHGFFSWVSSSKGVDRAMEELCAWLRQQFSEKAATAAGKT
jgi:acetyl esterase